MEFANVELRPQFFFCPLPQFLDFELADFVGERLARPGNVAVNLAGGVVFGGGDVGQKIVDGLLSSPVLVVHSGVDTRRTARHISLLSLPKRT